MSEENEESGEGGSDSSLWTALGSASREKANVFLEEQTAFVRLQKEHLHEQRLLVLSHLKWRRFDDQLKGALQIILVVLGAVAIVVVGAAIWNASHADGLVIDEFSAPPAFAQAGITGDVIADDITAKLDEIRQFATDNSFSRSKDVSANHRDDVRVEIPTTGISISEAWRYLRNWLGHERHISGSLRDAGNGKVTLAVAVEGATPIVVSGPASDLDRLEDQAAERVFGEVDLVNIINYLAAKGRINDALAAAEHYVPIAVTPSERSDSYGLWTYTTAAATGDIRLAVRRARIGVSIDPKLAVVRVQLALVCSYLGWDEETLRQSQTILTLEDADQLPAHRGGGFASMVTQASARVAYLLGDYASAPFSECGRGCTLPGQLISEAKNLARLHDPSGAERTIAQAEAAGSVGQSERAEARALDAAARDEWRAALDHENEAASAYNEGAQVSPRFYATVIATQFEPMIAIAQAHLGEFAQAHHTIDSTPSDCYDCARARGTIDAMEHNVKGATFWFSYAVAQAPSLPLAYTDWGAMLLHDGDYDGAIAKLETANQKGPHYSDALEMWGEALMQKNRSDLALTKFEDAGKYAPNWGRLHLKWGEALYYTGKKDEADKQFATAAALDLSPFEKDALASWMTRHD